MIMSDKSKKVAALLTVNILSTAIITYLSGMTKRCYIILLTIFAMTSTSYAQSAFTSSSMYKQIMQHNNKHIDPLPYLMPSEYLIWNYPAQLTATFQLLESKKERAVVAMTVTDTAGQGITRYLYFVNDSLGWKHDGTVRPTLEQLHRRRLREMEEMTPAQVDSMLAEVQHQEDPPYKTREDFNFTRNSLRLKLAPDDTLIAHFNRHKAEFKKLRRAAADSVKLFLRLQANDRKKKIATDYAMSESNTLVPTQTAALQPLLISNITTHHELSAGQFDFHILYDQVGYVYAPKKAYRPEMSKDGVIVVRKLGKGWYLYKVQVYL